jgi:hypothetical protein
MYIPGETVETDDDLLQFNAPGYPPKFELESGERHDGRTVWDPSRETIEQFALRMQQLGLTRQQPTSTVESLKGLTLEQLQSLAADEEIEVPTGASKEVLVGVLAGAAAGAHG